MFENRVLRGIFGPERGEVRGCWRNCIVRNFKIIILHKNNIRIIESE
jgi:hypothetical protein